MKRRKHICSTCSKSFTRASIWRDHLRAHEGIKPHQCGICGFAFTRTWDLKSHTLIHAQPEPYKCDGCGARFRRKHDVLRHQERKKGSRCRVQAIVPTQIEQDVQAAGALAGLRHVVLENEGSQSWHIRKERSEWALCPLVLPQNYWMRQLLESISKVTFQPHCQVYAWSDVQSLRTHLRSDHGLHLLCTECSKYIQAGRGLSHRPYSAVPDCHDNACTGSSMIIPESLPESSLQCFGNGLTYGDNDSPFQRWDALLPWYSTKPSRLYNPGRTETTSIILAFDCGSISHSRVTGRRNSAPPKTLPSLDLSMKSSLEVKLGGRAPASEQLARSFIPNLEEATQPEMSSNGTVSKTPAPLPSSAQEGTDQNQHIALQPPTLANMAAISKEPDLSVHDDFSTPRPDLLKVIVDITNYLRDISAGKVSFQLRLCQWYILSLFLARLDEISKTDVRVTFAHSDALWAEYDAHREAFRSLSSKPFDEAFDQIIQPWLHWREWEPPQPLISVWVADFRVRVKTGCYSATCPCENYLWILKPHGGCVTALRAVYNASSGCLNLLAGDKIRLISQTGKYFWEGQCIRTGQTGSFLASVCA